DLRFPAGHAEQPPGRLDQLGPQPRALAAPVARPPAGSLGAHLTNHTPVYIILTRQVSTLEAAMTEPLTITRITHSCHLIQLGARPVPPDPGFPPRPLYPPGEPIARPPAELPGLAAVVISHHHYDHCDLAAFAAYPDKSVPMIVAGPVAR